MNDAQEETDDMEWEEMGMEEKLERVRKKKEDWEIVRFAKNIVLELGERADPGVRIHKQGTGWKKPF